MRSREHEFIVHRSCSVPTEKDNVRTGKCWYVCRASCTSTHGMLWLCFEKGLHPGVRERSSGRRTTSCARIWLPHPSLLSVSFLSGHFATERSGAATVDGSERSAIWVLGSPGMSLHENDSSFVKSHNAELLDSLETSLHLWGLTLKFQMPSTSSKCKTARCSVARFRPDFDGVPWRVSWAFARRQRPSITTLQHLHQHFLWTEAD